VAAKYDVIVVGLGAMGSATLYHLAKSGRRVLGVEQFRIGHARGSSHGESRVIRLSYFEDPRYVPLLRRAYENWEALGRAAGRRVLVKTGIIECGDPEGFLVRSTLRASDEHAIPHEVWSSRKVAEQHPGIKLPNGWVGVHQADGGFVRPGLAVRLHTSLAQHAGAEVISSKAVADIRPHSGGLRLKLDDGSMLEAGSVVLTTGAWTSELVPILGPPRLQPTRQLLAWFQPRQPELFELGRFPVFLVESGEDFLYGFPTLSRHGLKAANHRPGPPIADIDARRARPAAEEVERVRELLQRFLPKAAGELKRMQTCVYTNTPDGHFAIGPHPEDPRIIIASPCSGHGFKFASVIGEVLARLATGSEPGFDISLFSLDRLMSSATATGVPTQ
jgi:sarcosine oxidase